MCGIVSLCYGHHHARLGVEAGALLKRLEYRGYDSTGGAFMADDGTITLLKGVGAPSVVVPQLGIDAQSGQRFVGQVRWATYGAVTQDNCQPHQMACKLPFVGAHNGNVSNTDVLKTYLSERGHQVVSDNDGEMVTHLTEHFYADALTRSDAVLPGLHAAARAAEVDIPDRTLLLIHGARAGHELAEGSYAASFCDPAAPGVVAVKAGSSLYAGLGTDADGPFVVVSSDLTSVLSKTRELIPLHEGQGLWFTEDRYVVFPLAGELAFTTPTPVHSQLDVNDTALRQPFDYYMDQEIASIPENLDHIIEKYLDDPDPASDVAVRLGRFTDVWNTTRSTGGRIYLVASGTSYHAALTGAMFTNTLAGLAVFPCNPGMFRSMYLSSLTPQDVVVAITQSGETKDLVDILLDVHAKQPQVHRLSIVNNENSRIPQELSDVYLPLLCGPEMAVAATKSFINQLAVLYIVAACCSEASHDVRSALATARRLVSETLEQCGPAIDDAAKQLFLAPSMHILGTNLLGVAREGALKIREVVLNHTEGYDAAEFKHGPNTILGRNTIFSLPALQAAVEASGRSDFAHTLEAAFGNYPLVFVCPPDPRDIRITISQVHTHKIRGADVMMFAEANDDLRRAVEGVPAGVENYRSTCVTLPRSDNPCLFVFSAAVALQRLSFRMSELKMEHLDQLGVRDHGVHPDAPKNVSKSITVD